MDLHPLAPKRNLADLAYDRLVEAIVAGELRAGDRLVMDRIAEQLGISRTPVRDALARLERDGLLDVANRGYTIRTTTGHDLNAIYDAREAVEGHAAWLLAQRPSDELKVVRVAVANASDQDTTTAAGAFAANRAIHRAVVEATGNPVLLTCFDAIWHSGLTAFAFTERYTPTQTHTDIGLEHAPLLEALESGDPERARHAMVDHLAGGRRIADTG